MREQQDGNVGDRYRYVRHHPVFGVDRRAVDGAGGRAAGRGGAAGSAQVARRAGGGPGRVRPAVVPLPSRPAQPPRPGTDTAGADARRVSVGRVGPSAFAEAAAAWTVGTLGTGRTLSVVRPGPMRTAAAGVGHADTRLPVRRDPAAPSAGPGRRTLLLRRAVAGVGLVVCAALVVLALGLLADGVTAARLPDPTVSSGASAGGERIVTVDAPGTVWDLAGRIRPGATPVEQSALVGRIVTANALTAGEVHPGQVLRVPSG